MSGVVDVLTVAAAVGTGLVGGVFFAFSAFVMPALRGLAPVTGVAAMQAVNRSAVRPPLMAALFGTAAVVVAVPVLVGISSQDRRVLLLVSLAAVAYLLGTVAITVVGNVPLNDRLAAQSAPAVTEQAWTAWVDAWTRRNHVRTVAALVASALCCVALGASGT